MKNKIYYLGAFVLLVIIAAFLYQYIYLEQKPTQSVSGNPPVNAGKKPAPVDQASCEKTGGIWTKGIAGGPLCDLPVTDAGKICSDQKDCQGDCVAELSKEQEELRAKQGFIIGTGKCTNRTLWRGCGYYVEQGKIVAACKD